MEKKKNTDEIILVSVVKHFIVQMAYYNYNYFFSKLASGRNPANPAIWLVPRAGSFLLSNPSGIVGSFIQKIVCGL